MLELLLTSKARVRILSYLLFSGEHHLREIARETGTIPIHVSKELQNLEKAGVISMKNIANLKLFSMNQDCPYLDDLRRIFIKTEYIGEILRKGLRDADFALIYGSLAKGDFTSGSDIDLLVIGGLQERELEQVVDLAERKIGREINYILWTMEDLKRKQDNSLLKSILAGQVIMVKGEELEARKAMGKDSGRSRDGRKHAQASKTGS